MTMATIELTRKEMKVLDTWMRQFASDYAASLNPEQYSANPIHRSGEIYVQSQIIGRASDIEDKVLAEVAKILSLPNVDRSSYHYLQDDLAMIVEIANYELEGWELQVINDQLVLSRCWNSFRELWHAELEHLVPVSERPTDLKKCCIEVDMEVLKDSPYLKDYTFEDAVAVCFNEQISPFFGRVRGIIVTEKQDEQ